MSFLSSVLDYTMRMTTVENKIRGDQASLLVLACATFRQIPTKEAGKCNMAKYLHFSQETISHARWLTTASGYLRLKLFDIFDLDDEQNDVLKEIVQFILDVYVPSFFCIYLHPSAIQGPMVYLEIRKYMKACDVSGPAKKCFLDHGVNWLNPKTAALGALHNDIDMSRLSVRQPDTRALLWSNRPLVAFLNASSSTSPCLTTGSKEDWMAFRNNNTCCERLIGQIKEVINQKKIKDTVDVDKKVKGYINLAYY